MVASYVAWRTDQVLYYGSYTLDIDGDDIGSCIFVQDCALGGEARTKEYNLVLFRTLFNFVRCRPYQN